jgi:hypothetical protein
VSGRKRSDYSPGRTAGLSWRHERQPASQKLILAQADHRLRIAVCTDQIPQAGLTEDRHDEVAKRVAQVIISGLSSELSSAIDGGRFDATNGSDRTSVR